MIRAVICDLYGTVLEVGPPPPHAESRWRQLWIEHVGSHPVPTLAELDEAVRARIPARHAVGRAAGLVQPEIDWPQLAEDAFPSLRHIPAEKRPDFYYRHATLLRTTRLPEGAARCLQLMARHGLVLGIASNAQACTRLELAAALSIAGVPPSVFHPDLQFWSYLEGFAKPDPRVFSSLTGRLASHPIAPAETLMVGDRLDTDIAPAHLAGWSAWHLQAGQGPLAGPWPALQEWLGIR